MTRTMIKYKLPSNRRWKFMNILTFLTSPGLTDRMISVDCAECGLTSLPPLPKCRILNCEGNYLAILPSLPSCRVLNCEGNYLTILPELPECVNLRCQNNRLPAFIMPSDLSNPYNVNYSSTVSYNRKRGTEWEQGPEDTEDLQRCKKYVRV